MYSRLLPIYPLRRDSMAAAATAASCLMDRRIETDRDRSRPGSRVVTVSPPNSSPANTRLKTIQLAYLYMMAVITRAASSTATQSASKGKSSAIAAPRRVATAKKARSTSSSSAARSASSSKANPQSHHDDPPHVTRTSDGHFIVVSNRKWRATDPLIPETELAQLKHYLAKGRSGTRVAKGKGKEEADAAIKLARKRTGIAKRGLGERGKPEWWNDTEEGRKKRWEDALSELEELAKDGL